MTIRQPDQQSGAVAEGADVIVGSAHVDGEAFVCVVGGGGRC